MHRVRYVVRAFFLFLSAVVPVVIALEAFQSGRLQVLDTVRALNMVAGALVIVVPLSLLLLRELVEIVWSPETRDDWQMIASSRSEFMAYDIIGTMIRAPIGLAIFVVAALVGMHLFFGVGGLLLLLGWMVGFGERRILYGRQRRQIFIEGYLLPDWIELRRALATSVHMTRYHGNGSHTDYKAVLLTGPRTLVDLQLTGPTQKSHEAESKARVLAARLGLAYVPNPKIEEENRLYGRLFGPR